MTAKNKPLGIFFGAEAAIIATCALTLAFSYGTSPGMAAQAAAKDDNEAFLGENGDLFMEEVTDPKSKPQKKPLIPIDLSRVGVSVDPHGNIVPIKDSPDDAWAGTGVKPFMNEIQNTFQALPFNGFAGATPYGYGIPGVNMPGYADPRLNYRSLGYPSYGYPGYGYPGAGYGYPGYPGYGYQGYPGYGYQGYRPGININFGGGRGGISLGGPGYNNGYYNNGFSGGGNPYYGNAGFGRPYYPGYNGSYAPYGYPAVGAPLASFNIGKFQGAIGSSGPGIYPNAANSVFFPSTTNYSGTSMWRAFNLAF